MEWSPMVFSIVGSLFGLVSTTLMGMCINKFSSLDRHLELIEHHLEQLNGKVFVHVTASALHEAGLVRLEEQVKNVLEIAKIAHSRAEKLENSLKD